MKLAELRKQGYKALTDALGIVGMIRFLQQFDVGEGDYTRDRAQWLDLLTMHDFQAYVREQQIDNRIE
jgi:acyl-CoA thioesterase FadM